jgi:hypothetical protein
MNNHELPTLLSFRLLHYYATKTISSRSSMYICNWESGSLKSSSSSILHWERANKVFGKRSSRLLNPLHQTLHHGSSTSSSIARGASSHLPRTSSVCAWSLGIYCCWEVTLVYNLRIISYILNMLIIVDMILLDNLLQCFLFIIVIDLYVELVKVLLF